MTAALALLLALSTPGRSESSGALLELERADPAPAEAPAAADPFAAGLTPDERALAATLARAREGARAAWPGFEAAGGPAYARRLRAGERADQVARLAVHERFRAYQREAFSRVPAGGAYPALTGEAVAWAALEQRALADALTRPEEAYDLLRTFQAVRLYRYEAFGREAAAVENEQERLEGTARYVELLCLGHERPLVEVLSGELYAELEPAAMEKDRYLSTGPAMDLALDEVGAGWKARVEAGEAPADVLFSSLGPMGEGERTLRLEAAKKAYGYRERLAVAIADLLRRP
jgi:hypothetical protein